MKDLYEALQDYAASDWYRFHMPGHKGNLQLMQDIYAIDITEIDGFDDLHHAEGILLEAQQRAAELYGSEETFYLVGGSTSGILSSVFAACRRGDHILAARNCHKSVYHAIELNQLVPHWLFPTYDSSRGIFGSVSPESVKRELEKDPDIRAVILTSPTYEGIVSDIRTIARTVHEHGAVLIVDEAHGAHFGMHPQLPENALSLGADFVVCSLHKTLPSLTSTALLHVNGPLADRDRLKKYMAMFQTSSPSYVLMAGMDRCIRLLAEKGPALFETYMGMVEEARFRLKQMQALHLLDGTEASPGCFAFDRSRFTITTENSSLSGNGLYAAVRERFHLQPEMAGESHTVFITSPADTQEGFTRLTDALCSLDLDETSRERKLSGGENSSVEIQKASGEDYRSAEFQNSFTVQNIPAEFPNPETVLLPGHAVEETAGEQVPLDECTGRVSLDYVYLYPPGIPLLVPGERVTQQVTDRIRLWRNLGFALHGMKDRTGRLLTVCI